MRNADLIKFTDELLKGKPCFFCDVEVATNRKAKINQITESLNFEWQALIRFLWKPGLSQGVYKGQRNFDLKRWKS